MLSDMIMKKKDVKNLQNRLKSREIFVIRFVDSLDDAHHVPTYDIVQHTVSVSCECQPTFRDTFPCKMVIVRLYIVLSGRICNND